MTTICDKGKTRMKKQMRQHSISYLSASTISYIYIASHASPGDSGTA